MKGQINRRDFLRLAGGVAMGVLAAACKPSTPPTVEVEKVATKPAEPAELVTITHMASGPPRPLENCAKVFNEKQDKISVEVSIVPANFWDKLSTTFAAGAPPDVCGAHTSTIRSYADMGALMDLNPYIEATADWPQDWFETVWIQYEYHGSQWGIPWGVGPRGTYYNTTMFDEAGIDRYPGEGWTWDDARQWGMKLTVDRNGKHPNEEGFDARNVAQWGMTGHVPAWSNMIRPFIITFGGDVFNEDSTECTITQPEPLECLKWLNDALNTWHIHSSREIDEEMGDIFTPGNAGIHSSFMGPASAFAKEKPDFEWGCAIMPKKARHVINVGSSGHSMPAKAAHPDAAWEWLRFQASDESHAIWAKDSRLPPRKSTSLLIIDVLNPPPTFKETFIDAIDVYGVPVWQHVNRAQVEKALTDEFEMVWLGERTVEEAAEAAKEKVDKLLVEVD